MAKLATPEDLRAKAAEYKLKAKSLEQASSGKRTTFSHLVMGGIMLMFFVGVGLGVYVTIARSESASTTLDYIMQLAKIVSLGYFVKAFGENIAKIVLSSVFGTHFSNTSNEGDNGHG